jgi:hypothetical protein
MSGAAPEAGFTFGLRGPWRLAQSLMLHYGVDYEEHAQVASELGDVLGEELLSVARHFLDEKGLLDPPLEGAS